MPRCAIIKTANHSSIPYALSVASLEVDNASADSPSTVGNCDRTIGFSHRVQAVFNRCESEAHAIVENARREADAIRFNAKADAERLFTEAKTRGEHIGRSQATTTILRATAQKITQAVAAAKADAEACQSTYTELLEKLLAQRSSIIESAESELVALALGIAEQILQQEPHVDPTYVVNLTRRALTRFAATDQIRIRCAPQDHAVLVQHAVAFTHQAKQQLEFVSDSTLERGSLIVDSADGRSADASLRSQLAMARDRLCTTNNMTSSNVLSLAS